MGLASLLFSHPLAFLLLTVPLLYSIIAHEVAHGVAALLFGDETAKKAGRLTLNPLPHIHPVGALMLFLVGFGWARPVPVNYARLKRSRLGMVCVALAGCVTNFLIAMGALALLRSTGAGRDPLFSELLLIIARINITLGAFNLIPIPPLDGSKVLMGFLPQRHWATMDRLEPYGFGLLILLMVTGFLQPILQAAFTLASRLISLLF